MDILAHCLNLSWRSLFEIKVVIISIMRKFVQAHFTPLSTNISDCALYICQQFVFKDNSFSKKQQQLFRQPLWIRNSKTKIWKWQCCLSKLIFRFIYLDKFVRKGINKRLLFPIYLLLCYKKGRVKRRRALTSFTDNVQNSFLWTKESTWVYLLLMHILYIFLFQFVIFNLLSYCFEGTIGLDIKASVASCPVLHLIRWYN